jgi:hypothetical protein
MNQDELPIELLDQETGRLLGWLRTAEPRGGSFWLRAKVRGQPSRYFPNEEPGDIDRALYWIESQVTALRDMKVYESEEENRTIWPGHDWSPGCANLPPAGEKGDW